MNSGNSGNFLNCLKSWIYQFVVDVCLLVMRYIKLEKIQKIKEIYTLKILHRTIIRKLSKFNDQLRAFIIP